MWFGFKYKTYPIGMNDGSDPIVGLRSTIIRSTDSFAADDDDDGVCNSLSVHFVFVSLVCFLPSSSSSKYRFTLSLASVSFVTFALITIVDGLFNVLAIFEDFAIFSRLTFTRSGFSMWDCSISANPLRCGYGHRVKLQLPFVCCSGHRNSWRFVH